MEIAATITGLLNVWLLARQSIWNWPLGIATTALYFFVFLRTGLYGDAGLQLIYVTLNAFGWWYWLRPRDYHEVFAVSRTSGRTWSWLAPAIVFCAVGLAFLLSRLTKSDVPQWDGVTTSLSLAATYGQTKKLLESWWLWIAADLIYIPLYAYKQLWWTAGLYVVFLALCIIGLRDWRRCVAT